LKGVLKMFNKRLEEYRNGLHITKRELADKLEMSESYYNMIENGKRNPSRTFILKLVALSGKPEEYWIYGIDDNEYRANREDFKATTKAVDQLLELKLINNIDDIFQSNYQKGTLEELLIAALKTDIEYLMEKKK
jgi:transcriptional regulator with XRE-family HTH domain